MSKVKIMKCYKSFRLFDFHVFDQNKNFFIEMFGINENGETASIIVNDYKPFFYLKVDDKWEESYIADFEKTINTNCYNYLKSVKLVNSKELYGFNNNKKVKFLQLIFDNSCGMNKVKSFLLNKENRKKIGFDINIYESSIPPLLRYFHINSISPSGWVKVNSLCLKKDNDSTTCDFNYVCGLKDIKPENDKESLVPYKICSFDIEASSSHGDFPVPVKSFKKLATNIVDIYKLHEPDKNHSKKLIEKIILTAFGFKKFEGVDLVYPKEPPQQESVKYVIKILLEKELKDFVIDEKTENIMNIVKIFTKDVTNDEDNEETNKKDKKVDVKLTIIDLLQSDLYARDKKIEVIDNCLTSLFKTIKVNLKGDEVTFIGSTFMKYGEKEPYLNHCLVLGGCDDVDGAVIESHENEENLIMAWKNLIMEEDPDIIIGYNIFGFDYEFIFRRTQELNYEKEFLKLSRKKYMNCYKMKDGDTVIENTKIVLATGEYDLKYYLMPGRLQIDMYTYFRRDFNLASYKLDDVAAQYISDDIKKMETEIIGNDTVTHLYSNNLTGLNIGDYIHIELCGFTTDYYDGGRKFQVKNIQKMEDGSIITINGSHVIDEKKSLKWTMAKDDVTPQDIFRLSKGSDADRAKVAKYCIQDCNLVHHLMNKIDVITGYVEMASICSVPISFLVLRGQGIKLTSYVAKKCREKNTLMPDLNRDGVNEGYEGAIVLPPKCSMYMDNPVACVDYASLYPSSMISQNYSHDSKVWTKEYDLDGNLTKETGEKDENGNFIYDNLPEYEYINTEFDLFQYKRPDGNPKAKEVKTKVGKKICRWAQLPNNEKSIMPSILEELLRARKATKKLMKTEKDPFMENILDKRQLGYKVTANSLYGQCGARTSTFYEKDVAASTTATGRQMIMYAKGMVEEIYGNRECETKDHGKVLSKAEYVYGDTDSVFFTFNLEDPVTNEPIRGKKALEITIELAQEVAETCNLWLKPPMGLEYEKTLMPFVLLSKKRYVGMLYEFNANKGKLKYMGLSLKRRDSCDYLKDTYGEILNILMKENDVEKSITFLNSCLDDLINGKVSMDKLAITRALRSDYKNPSQIAHRVLADRIGERDPGNKPKPGDRIKYVFIDTNSPKSLLGERIETPEYISENKLKLDYNYYITNQLMKPLQQLYGLSLESILTNRGKTTMLRDYRRDIKKIKKDSKDDLELYAKNMEKYCSIKVKTILFDDVLTKIMNEKNRQNMRSIKSFFS